MLKFFRIRGNSMRPDLQEGDIVLALTWRRLWRLKAGVQVIFEQPGYGMLVKRIERILPDGRLFVTARHAAGVDSHEFGPLRGEEIRGTVVWVWRAGGGRKVTGGPASSGESKRSK